MSSNEKKASGFDSREFLRICPTPVVEAAYNVSKLFCYLNEFREGFEEILASKARAGSRKVIAGQDLFLFHLQGEEAEPHWPGVRKADSRRRRTRSGVEVLLGVPAAWSAESGLAGTERAGYLLCYLLARDPKSGKQTLVQLVVNGRGNQGDKDRVCLQHGTATMTASELAMHLGSVMLRDGVLEKREREMFETARYFFVSDMVSERIERIRATRRDLVVTLSDRIDSMRKRRPGSLAQMFGSAVKKRLPKEEAEDDLQEEERSKVKNWPVGPDLTLFESSADFVVTRASGRKEFGADKIDAALARFGKVVEGCGLVHVGGEDIEVWLDDRGVGVYLRGGLDALVVAKAIQDVIDEPLLMLGKSRRKPWSLKEPLEDLLAQLGR